MHHYGEDAAYAFVSEDDFTIELRQHQTGATLRLTGPLYGVFEDPDRRMDEGAAMELAYNLAQFMAQATASGEATAGA